MKVAIVEYQRRPISCLKNNNIGRLTSDCPHAVLHAIAVGKICSTCTEV
ncbi:hypothetical protein [Nostoc sp. 'Peltigera membranacea cyanobiont' 213]|nr:hypothetical protein [Nostoc sp. 'Peltigera membranacea cyanobiont' 213]